MTTWTASIEYDGGRLGKVGCAGLASRDDAIAWLDRVFAWSRDWYKLPSMFLETSEQWASRYYSERDAKE